ncbi:hypothetical protein Ocin01_19613, partial [Orchesella cincta]
DKQTPFWTPIIRWKVTTALPKTCQSRRRICWEPMKRNLWRHFSEASYSELAEIQRIQYAENPINHYARILKICPAEGQPFQRA